MKVVVTFRMTFDTEEQEPQLRHSLIASTMVPFRQGHLNFVAKMALAKSRELCVSGIDYDPNYWKIDRIYEEGDCVV